MKTLPYKISTLIYLRNEQEEILLMRRNRAPNAGFWSPIGGKLEMETGESPFETAIREVGEEVDLGIGPEDLHLFAMIAEKNYEDQCHWLMFLFACHRRLRALPPPIAEGTFAFFPENEIMDLEIPETDRIALWPVYFHSREDFTVFRADCRTGRPFKVEVEEAMKLAGRPSSGRLAGDLKDFSSSVARRRP